MPTFLAFCTALLMGMALFAFRPTYLGKPFAPVDAYTHFHAAIGVLWLLLLLTQSLLAAARRHRVHRALGRLSYLLAPLFVLSSVLLAHYRFSRMDDATFVREGNTLYLPLSAALLFAAAFSLALRYRRNPRLHGRFMASTALLLVDPVLGRFLAFYVIEFAAFWHYQIVTFGVECAALLALYRTLPAQPAERRPFARFAATYAAVLVLWFVLPRTEIWQDWAQRFRELPLT